MENDYKYDDFTIAIMLLARLTGSEEEQLATIPARHVRPLVQWMMPEIVHEKLMTVEKWFELCFHLQKQRWDESMDWLESQPMSKVLLMTRVQSGFVESQNRAMKKANRGK